MKTYHVAAKQESRPAHEGLFYSATVYWADVSSQDNFIVSSGPDGLGDFAVDDVITVKITDMNDSTNSATYTYNFFENGRGGKPLAPVNLNEVDPAFDNLRGCQVKITVDFSDKYGGVEWGNDIYVTLRS